MGGIREDPNAVIGVVPLWAFLFSGGTTMKCNKTGAAASRKNTTPSDLFYIITEKNHALRALGALLGTAKLSAFDSENYLPGSQGKFEVENLQFGLSKLIDLYLDDMERTVATFADEYLDSDEYLVERAAALVKMTEEGASITGHIPKAQFCETLGNLQTVIDRKGVYSSMAGNLKTSLMRLAPHEARPDNDKEAGSDSYNVYGGSCVQAMVAAIGPFAETDNGKGGKP